MFLNNAGANRSFSIKRAKGSYFFDSRGVTLVEVLIACVIFLLVSLALTQTALITINANMSNVLRDEAARIAEARMAELKDAYIAGPGTGVIQSTAGLNVDDPLNPADPSVKLIRSFRLFTVEFTRQRNISDINSATSLLSYKQINVTVNWNWKGQSYSHSVSAIVRNPNA